jgi:hypothetical protein
MTATTVPDTASFSVVRAAIHGGGGRSAPRAPGHVAGGIHRAGGVEALAVTETAVPHELALFVTDDELHQRIAPHLGRDRFRAALKDCERDLLFPRTHPLWRGRYWPSVRAWLDRNQEIGSNDFAGSIQDGPENFDAPTRQSPRVKARPKPAAVLDRPAGGPRPHGFPRQVHPAPGGR